MSPEPSTTPAAATPRPQPSEDFEIPEEDRIEQDRDVVHDEWTPDAPPGPAVAEPIIPDGSEADVIDQRRPVSALDDDERRVDEEWPEEPGA
jgi:hypothetical protein